MLTPDVRIRPQSNISDMTLICEDKQQHYS